MNTDAIETRIAEARALFEDEQTQTFVVNYLRTLTGSDNIRIQMWWLKTYFDIVQKTPLEVRRSDWAAVRDAINATGNKTSSKEWKRAILRAFFESVAWDSGSDEFLNPIPPSKKSGFTRAPNVQRNRTLTVDQIKTILSEARSRCYEYYLIFLILAHCGMRIRELLTVKRKDVHLVERWLETGMCDGATKSNKHGNRRIIFPFPPQVRFALEQYLTFSPASEWLFPMVTVPTRPYHYQTIATAKNRMQKRLGIQFSTHWFRHSLNHYRRYVKKVSREDRKKLLNHISTDAIERYDDAYISDLVKLYDESHPYGEL